MSGVKNIGPGSHPNAPTFPEMSTAVTMPVLGELGLGNDPLLAFMAVMLKRSQLVESEIMSQVEDIKARNAWLDNAAKMLNDTRARTPKDAKAHGWIPNETKQWLKDNNISGSLEPEWGNQGKFTTLIENMKSAIDRASSSTQLDMIRFNGLNDKLKNTYEMMSNVQAKHGQLLDGIARKTG